MQENLPQNHPSSTVAAITDAIDQLRPVLAPRLKQLKVSGTTVQVRNLIGSVPLNDGSILDIEPKVETDVSWAEAVVQLITETSRIAVTGSQRSSLSPSKTDLSSALAIEYARRLEKALAQEGPLQVYEHHQLTSRRPNGHLNIGKWVRTALLNPAMFPIERDDLTVANDFTRGLSIVAGYLRRSASSQSLRARLRRLETLVAPGIALPSYVNPAVAQRHLPAQWAKYKPAWDIAAAVLRNRSIVGDPGRSVGLEVAIEPWPLLETLLERTLAAATQIPGSGLQVEPKAHHTLLKVGKRVATNVIPDGILRRNGTVVATFEAKYTRLGETPSENHVYQALSAAAALRSPLSVIVYPSAEPAKRYDVAGFSGTPTSLVTIGLDIYKYKRGLGDQQRAQQITELLVSR
ncbi:hypothetical protein IWX63_003274 [Arthrobacter sp. CAN_A2]|uniref:5-methylcytosine restriction system specificity protein McrC n=1 Tax=Arthrobacter sp. CAN_A2 TaxID=2787718 RepID=UPI0018EF8F56